MDRKLVDTLLYLRAFTKAISDREYQSDKGEIFRKVKRQENKFSFGYKKDKDLGWLNNK